MYNKYHLKHNIIHLVEVRIYILLYGNSQEIKILADACALQTFLKVTPCSSSYNKTTDLGRKLFLQYKL